LSSTAELLSRLSNAGIRIRLENGNLIHRAPKGAVTAEIAQELKARKEEIVQFLRTPDPIPRCADQPDFELSHAQKRLWLLAQFEDASTAYNVPLHQTLEGPLNADALEAAFHRLVERHESLRTTFEMMGAEPRQVIHRVQKAAFRYLDYTGKPPESVIELGRRESAEPFDLVRGPLLRATLIRTAPHMHTLLLTLHHLVCDGVSLVVLAKELGALYSAFARGAGDSLPPLRIHYRDFAQWQNALLASAAVNADRSYWQGKLPAPHPVLDLPLDFPRPAEQSFTGREHSLELPPALLTALKALAKETHSSLFILLVAIVKVLLYRYTGQREIVIGSPFAGQDHPELTNQIGFYLNMLPLRDRVDGDSSFRAFLQQVRQTTTEAFDHRLFPFDRIVEDTEAPRDLSRSALFDVSLILQSQKEERLQLQEVTATPSFEHPGTSKFDVTFCFKEMQGGQLMLAIEYCTALFAASRIERMANHFQTLATAIIANPSCSLSALDMIAPAERTQLLQMLGPSVEAAPDGATFLDLFGRQVDRTPQQTAVTSMDGSSSLSYADLDQRSSDIARALRARGIQTEDRVAVLLPRTPDLVAVLMGVWKAGAAYVPLDPALPEQRLQLILGNASPRLVITPEVLAALPVFSEGPLPQVDARQLAYVIYTSGSTGIPKGVEINHSALVNFLRSMSEKPGLQASDVLLAVTTVSFDIAALELFLPLIHGAKIVLADRSSAADGDALLAAMERHGVTVMQATPVTWKLLLAAGWDGRRPLRAFCGGEALRLNLAREITSRATILWNLYGPTETTIWSAACPVIEPVEDPVPVGGAIAHTQLYVLGDRLQLQPVGVPGQLYIAGAGLARGYHRNAALTAEKFLPDPFAGNGSRMYATGDLVRMREDGSLSFLGRIDHQVKVRGHRVELGDIESAIGGHADVRECIVAARPDAAGETALCAYIVQHEASLSSDALSGFLRPLLPEYMIPQSFVFLDAWPLTPNGKVDRNALPDPGQSTAGGRAARNAEEQILCEMFADVLSVNAVKPSDDFFRLGGHSLLAVHLINRVRAVFQVDLPFRVIFDAPSPSALASRLRGGETSRPPLTRQQHPSPMPVSWAQMRIWFLHRMDPTGAAYTIPAALHLNGDLETPALEAALNDVVSRHEGLRTIFPEIDGAPVQEVLPPEHCRIRLDAEVVDAQRLRTRIAEAASERLDLSRDIPLKAWLFQLEPRHHVVLFVLHHIASDAWSLQPFTRDLASAYSARVQNNAVGWKELPVQYTDYTLWQRECLGNPSDPQSLYSRQLTFWKTALAGMPEQIRLPFDRPRPAVVSYQGGVVTLQVDASLHASMLRLARTRGVTLFMMLQAALAAFLSRMGAGDDIPIGAPVAGRHDAALDDVVGVFVNTLVLRNDLSGNPSFEEVLERVRTFDLRAFGNQELPFEQLVEAMQPSRSRSRQPLFQVMLALQNANRSSLPLPGLSIQLEPVETTTAKFDIAFMFDEMQAANGAPGGMEARVEYSTDLFERQTAESLAARFLHMLRELVTTPSAPLRNTNLLLPGERARLLSPTSRELSGTSIVQSLERRAAEEPDALAMISNANVLSYGEMNRRVNRLASVLVNQYGAGPEALVGICLHRSFDLIVAVLAVLKTGAAYLPLDPTYPVERLAQIWRDASPVALVCSTATASVLPDARIVDLDSPSVQESIAAAPCEDPVARAVPQNTAYVIYTSGSTGVPKGILVQHAGWMNLAAAFNRKCAMTSHSRMLQYASINFDASALEIAMAITAGAALVLMTSADRAGGALAAMLREHAVTHLLLPPAVLATIEDSPDLAIECLMVGGEACPSTTAARWSGRRLLNAYGPSEITVAATLSDPLGDGRVPIGRPIDNCSVYVLDEWQQLLPPGTEGELFVGGVGVARGYLGRPDLTAERFLPDPFAAEPGARMYRTGDRGRWLPDGQLEFLGRTDFQVKVRGNRVELQEIEAVIRRHPAVTGAAVVATQAKDGNTALVAYVEMASASTPQELRELLASRLPAYMVPAVVQLVNQLPLTASGKVDREGLSRLSVESSSRDIVPPRDAVDRVLLAMFREVLHISDASITEEFFTLGGHSLSASQLISRIRDLFGVELPIAAFFERATISALADALRKYETRPGRIDAVAKAYERMKAMSPEERARLLESRSAEKRAGR